MTLYDELVPRGLIAKVTNEEEIKKMIAKSMKEFAAALLASEEE